MTNSETYPAADHHLSSLPLAPFESYMLADHRDDYPMHFYFRLVLQGNVRRQLFERSLAEAIGRHPLLRARIRPRFSRSPAWEHHGDVFLREASYDFSDLSEVQQSPPIDLTSESGLRTWLFSGPAETELLFEFHHSCCDGLGALAFLEDVLVVYDRNVIGTAPGEDVVHKSQLSSRAKIPLSRGQALRNRGVRHGCRKR